MIAAETFDDARAFLVDLDGTLIHGRTLLPGALDLLHWVRNRFAVVSNDAEHTPRQMALMLQRLGVDVPESRIVLAGATTIDLLASEQPRARVLLLASAALQRYAVRAGLRLADETPDVVVIARDRRFSFARLAKAANAVRGGAALVATNPDRSHPGPGGTVVPETGALLSAVLSCVGPVPHRVIGKPEPALFLAGLARLGADAANAVVIGDNPETDGLGAKRLGICYLHVEAGRLTGGQ